MRELLKTVVNDYKKIAARLFFLITIVFTSVIYNYLNNYRGKVYHIQTPIDAAIPFNKYFVVAYIGWYLYLGVFLLYYAIYDERKYFKLLWGLNTGMIICFIIYYLFPTFVPRPEVHGSDIFADAVRFIYRTDNPYNCFPSIHVFDSVLFAIYINRDEKFSAFTKLLSSAIVIIIIFSTFFIKQHYVYDAISGAFISYLVYFMFNYKEVIAKFQAKQGVVELDEK